MDKVVNEAIVNKVAAALPEEEILYDVAELFKVFGDSTRIRIICALFESCHILYGGHSRYFFKSCIERAFRSETTFLRKIFQNATAGSQQLLGIFHPIPVQQSFQVTFKIPIHHIGKIGLVRINHSTQLFQRQFWIQKHLLYLQLVKQILVDQTIYFPVASTFHDKFLLPVFFNSFEEQILLSLRSGTDLLTF